MRLAAGTDFDNYDESVRSFGGDAELPGAITKQSYVRPGITVALLALIFFGPQALRAQTTATIDINTAVNTPLQPGFSGVNADLGFPLEYWDARFNALAAQIGYGWLRFPGGASGDIYNWQTGENVAAWFTPFASGTAGPKQTTIALVAGRGGAKLLDAANRANFLGASLIICANAFTDTPQSIGQMAAYVKANHIPVAAWELANEAYLFPTFFPTATAYLDMMKPYRDAIKAVDPNAIVAVFVRDPGVTPVQNPWNAAMATYPNKYWDAIAFHHYPPQSSGNFAQWMADESAVLTAKTSTLVTGQLTPIGPPGVKFLNTEFDASITNDANTGAPSITDGTLWGGIYAAEYTMRMSTVPSMLYVGPNEITSFAGIFATNGHQPEVTAAANAGQPIDTSMLDFGFFIGAQAYGQAVLNSVINHATQSNMTTVTGGATVPATGITAGIPALYAMSYTNPAAGLSVVITNKSATAHSVTMRLNGLALTGTFPVQFVTGTDPSAANTATNQNAVVIQTGTSANPVTVGPYSVVRVDLLPAPFPDAGQSLAATGNSGSINLTFPPGFAWIASSSASWLTITSSQAGSGSGTLTYQLAPNTGGDRTATITVAGFTFTIEQQGTIAGLTLIGSMPHIAAQENWTTSFTLVNKGVGSTTARLSLFADPSGSLSLPLLFPQTAGSSLPEVAATLDRTISSNASLTVTSVGPQTPPVQIGSAQLSATGALDGFAIFHLIPGSQEAVVPMETRNASSYLLAYDNTNGVVLGVAVANVSAQAGTVGIVIRDDTGNQIGTGTLPMQANGHTSFVLSQEFPATVNKRGTIEFDTPSGGRISVLGIRTTPLGASNTLTTIPALANVGTNGGSIAHIATGNGWQTTFVLVNTGSAAAQVNLNFFADVTGAPLVLPLSFPQIGTASTASSVSRSLAAGASLLVQSAAPLSNPAPTTGSAQLTTNGNVGGFVIFRYNPNGQEAVVPLENRTANGFLIAFDNTAGTATGIAVNSASSQSVSVPVTVRDGQGNQLDSETLSLAANGHIAFTLVSDKYPNTAGIRGTIEFGTPPSGQIGALGIRIPVAHTFTTLPALTK
jgi:hypothetical protein